MSILPNLTPKKSSTPSPVEDKEQRTQPAHKGDGGTKGETLQLLSLIHI